MKKLFLPILLLACTAVFAQMPAGIDSTFGKYGYSVTVPSAGNIELGNHILTTDDKILFAGYTDGNNKDIFIAKTDQDGKTETSFGSNGLLLHDPLIGGDDRVSDLLELPDGKILAVGSMTGMQGLDALLIRFNSDGSIDKTFSNNGMALFNNIGDDYLKKLKVYNNRIYMAGYSNVNNAYTTAYVIRFNMDGTLDQAFGKFGITELDPNNGDKQNLVDFDIMADGSIVAIGATKGLTTRNYVCKMKPNGLVDSSFGKNGYYVHAEAAFATFLALKPGGNGGVYVLGSTSMNGYEVAFLLKVDKTGFLSNTFGSGNGKATLNTAPTSDQRMYDLEILDNGDIFLAGLYRLNGGIIKGLTALYKDDGNLNTQYGQGGYEIAAAPPGYALMAFRNISKTKDSLIILSGLIADSATMQPGVVLARLKKPAPPQSVHVINQQEVISIYPNPSTGMVRIMLENAKVDQAVFYNALGSVVPDVIPGDNNIYRFSDALPNGMYYIRVNAGGRIITRQIMLNR